MGYLAINMSGSSIPVYSASDIERDIKIGELSHRERFTVIQDGPIARVIQFVNPSGAWVQGRIKMSTNISDWSKYAFQFRAIGMYGFRTDAPVDMYDTGGRFVKTYPAGTLVVPYGRVQNAPTQTGDKNLDYMRIWGLYDIGGNPISGTTGGYFVDCKIRLNSMNTPVYGSGF